MKKTILLLLCLLLLSTPAAVRGQFGVSTNGDGTLTITNYTGPGGAVDIPSTINGLAVSIIGADVFQGNTNVTSVTIPYGVTNIGPSICQDCSSLGSISFPGSLPYVESGACWDCGSLTNATFGEGVSEIGPAAFISCAKLNNITFPASLTSIDDDTFAYCIGLTNMYFLGNAPSVISDSFGAAEIAYYLPCTEGWTNWNVNYTDVPAVPWWQMLLTWTTNDGNITITGCSNLCGTSTLTLPGTLNGLPVTAIGANAFANLTNLTVLNFPNSITNIEADAFAGCTRLVSIYFSDNAPAVDPSAFSGDTNATVYYLSGASGWSSTFGGVPALMSTPQTQFSYTTNVGVIDTITITGYTGPGGVVTIPEAINGLPVTGIAGDAFSLNANLTSVTIPSTITSVGDWAFRDCSSLTAITVAGGNSFYSSVNGVLFDGSQATLIQYPAGLVGSYTIPDTVNTVGDAAFAQSAGLLSVTVSGSVTNLDNSAFWACTALGSIYFLGNAPNLSVSTPIGPRESDGTPVFGPENGLTAYYLPGTSGWSNMFAATPEGEMAVPTVAATSPSQFNYTTNGGNIMITGYSGPGGAIIVPFAINGVPVTDIQSNAFEDATNLVGVTIPGSIISIGDEAFQGCVNLGSVTILPGLTNIGSSAFEGCSALAKLTIPESVISVGDNAFAQCSNLTAVYFDGDCPSAGTSIFENDPILMIYRSPCGAGWAPIFAGLPTSTAIASTHFSFSSNGAGLSITGYIGACEDVIIPSTINGIPVTEIAEGAFFEAPALSQVTIPGSIIYPRISKST
jgi:hypothetical protein